MNMTSLLVRALMLAVFATGVVTVAAFNRDDTPQPSPVAHSVAARARERHGGTADRLGPSDRRRNRRRDARRQLLPGRARHLDVAYPIFTRASPTLPSLGLDMPYYSFGKALPRVSKE